MAINSSRAIRAFLNSFLTVGLRSVVALAAFVYIARGSGDGPMAAYGIAYFFWGIIFISAQNFAAQPLIDLPRLRSPDVVSARVLVLVIAAALSLGFWLASPIIETLYPQVNGLDAALNALVWLGPLSVLGVVDLTLAQRQLRFGYIARIQTLSVVIGSLIAVAFAYSGQPIIGLLGIQAFASPIFALLSWRWVRTGLVQPKRASIRKLARVGRHLALEGNLAMFVIQGPIILFGLFLPAADLALFVLASRFIQLIASQLGRVTSLVLLPMVRREAQDQQRLHRAVMTASYFSNVLVAAPLIAMFAAPTLLLDALNEPVNSTTQLVFLLLVVKQLLDTAGNTVFSSFRAVGRPDAGWRWSLMFSAIWAGVAGIGYELALGIAPLATIMACTGGLSLGAVWWLCRTIKLEFRIYLRYIAPVFVSAMLALFAAGPLAAGFAVTGIHTSLSEIAAAFIVTIVFLGGTFSFYYLARTGIVSKSDPRL